MVAGSLNDEGNAVVDFVEFGISGSLEVCLLLLPGRCNGLFKDFYFYPGQISRLDSEVGWAKTQGTPPKPLAGSVPLLCCQHEKGKRGKT
jgi:hypothetical protein